MRVKNLTINFTYDHDGLPMKETIKTSTRPLANLRSLSIIGKGYPMCGEAYSNEAYQALPSDFQLPHLEHFTIRGVRELRMQDFVNLFTNHKSTLKSVVLIDITLIEINEGEHRQWKDLLETAKVLRPSVTFHIGVPFAHIPHLEQGGPYKPWGEKVFVCFTPSEDEPDREAVRVVMEAGGNDSGLHYFTQPGSLQQSLDCMVKCYKELVTEEEVRQYGARGRIYTEGDGSDESEGGNEDDFYEDYDEDYDEENEWDYEGDDYEGNDSDDGMGIFDPQWEIQFNEH